MRSPEIRQFGVYLARKRGKTFKVAVEGAHPDGGWIVTRVDPKTGVAMGRTFRFKSPRPFVKFLKMGWEPAFRENPRAKTEWFRCEICGKRERLEAGKKHWCRCTPAQFQMISEEMERTIRRALRKMGWKTKR